MAAERVDVLALFEEMKRELAADGPRAKRIPPVKYSCPTCHDLRRVHYVQDSGTGGYDLEPGGESPCPECTADETADALERSTFR